MKEKCLLSRREGGSPRGQGARLAPVLEPVWLEEAWTHLVEKIKESS